MFRLALCSIPLTLALGASTAFAQQAPPTPPLPPASETPPAPPPSPPTRDDAPPPRAHGPHHEGWHPGAMPHDANHAGVAPLIAREEARQEEERVITTVTSGSKNAILERQVATTESFGHVAIALPIHMHTESWQQVCVAPCKVDLSRASSYRVSASNGVPGTGSFTLTPNKSQLDLQVRPGNMARYATGGLLTGLGIGAFVTGAVLFTVAGKFEDESNIRIAGAITGGAGLVLMAVGIPLLVLNQTHVYADGTKLARKTPSGPRLGLGRIEF